MQISTEHIRWDVMVGDASTGDDYVACYCADNEGLVQVVDYGDRGVTIEDQLYVVKRFPKVDTEGDILAILKDAEKYLAATYNDVFQDFRIDR